MSHASNIDNGRITIDGHEECRSEIDALRRLVKLLEAEALAGRKYNSCGDSGSKQAYIEAIQATGKLK